MEQEKVLEEQQQIEVEVLPDWNDAYMEDLWHVEQPDMSQPAGGIRSNETMEMAQTDDISDTNTAQNENTQFPASIKRGAVGA